MKLEIYEAICGINEGYEQVRRNLDILARQPLLRRREVRRFEAWAAETCATTNSFLLHALADLEAAKAGRLFARRMAFERREDEKS